jgi:hypothetical protein
MEDDRAHRIEEEDEERAEWNAQTDDEVPFEIPRD